MLHCLIALQNEYFRWCMKDDIVDRVVSSSGCVVSMPTPDRLLKNLRLMASTGKSEEHFVRLGPAYLKENLHPDPRYLGCSGQLRACTLALTFHPTMGVPGAAG